MEIRAEFVVNTLFSAVGRVVVADQGYYPPCVKCLLKIVDFNALAGIITAISSYLPDFKEMRAQLAKNKAKSS